jgi:iron complex transport system ATP-binding protein
VIRTQNLSVSFGGVQALDSVTLTVERGEIIGLVGPNGAGKTTLLSAINGLVEPTAGGVAVNGDAVDGLSSRELARRVATVPQETSLSFAFPVREVVAMGRTPYRSRFERVSETDRTHTQRAMERTGVTRFADRSIEKISGGERQRVILARALCQNAPALLLDEPTASLDINHRIRLLSLLREFIAEGRAALCAIHDLSLAARFCDRLVLLADGRVLAAGAPETVLAEEHIEQAFDTAAAVTRHPVTGTVDVTATADRPERDARVHVLGGGQIGARAIATLAGAGFSVSAGVLPNGDAALETARAHGAETITTEPFAPVSAHARERASQLVRTADVAVLAGPNEPNRTLAANAERLVVVDGEQSASPDGFTDACVVGSDDLLAGVGAALDTDSQKMEPLADD